MKKAGERFELAGMTWTILEITEEGVKCIADSIGRREFDKNCTDWKESELRKYLKEEVKTKIEDAAGDVLIPFRRDLVTVDGLKDYKFCIDKVSLITFDEYRKYRELIEGGYGWWWTCTAWSLPRKGWEYNITVVSPGGVILSLICNLGLGVRPFCIFKSEILES